MKTALQILTEHTDWSEDMNCSNALTNHTIDAMQDYAKQVAEAVLKKAAEVARKYYEGDCDIAEIEYNIENLNLDQFIK